MTRSSVKGRDHDAKMQDSSDMIPFRDTSRVFFSFLHGRAATGYRSGGSYTPVDRARSDRLSDGVSSPR